MHAPHRQHKEQAERHTHANVMRMRRGGARRIGVPPVQLYDLIRDHHRQGKRDVRQGIADPSSLKPPKRLSSHTGCMCKRMKNVKKEKW